VHSEQSAASRQLHDTCSAALSQASVLLIEALRSSIAGLKWLQQLRITLLFSTTAPLLLLLHLRLHCAERQRWCSAEAIQPVA
jgi:hypothetical protein